MWRRLLEEGGWGKIHVGLAMAIALAGGGLIYQQVEGGGDQSCTQTFTTTSMGSSPFPGSDVQTAFAAASGGEVFCFTAGSGEIDLYNNEDPGTMVTFRPADGVSESQVDIYFNLNNVGHVTVDGMSGRLFAHDGVRYITYKNNTGTGDSVIQCPANDPNPGDGIPNILFDNNTMLNISPSGGNEGRLYITGCGSGTTDNGVLISNNEMAGGLSDGIQIGDDTWGTEITGNNIHDIIQGGDPHSDAIQGVGIEGVTITNNYIHNTSTGFLSDDIGSDVTITDNVIQTIGSRSIELGGMADVTVDHNTLNNDVAFGDDSGCCGGTHTTNLLVTNNVVQGAIVGNGGETWTYDEDYNLVESGTVLGANTITGSPTYVGGATPSTLAGWALDTGSLGEDAASDSTDMGAVIP